jgi:hypothetical protein
VFGVVILNPFKLDWQQRLATAIFISAFAYFVAHSIHKPKVSAPAVVTTTDPRIGSLEQQVNDLRSQQQRLLEQQAGLEKERKRKRQIREKLGDFLARGQHLMGQCTNEQVAAPDADANKWAEEVENYLQKELGFEYVARFRSGAGMPLSANSIQDQAHRNLWAGLNVRVYRLEQFLSELRE